MVREYYISRNPAFLKFHDCNEAALAENTLKVKGIRISSLLLTTEALLNFVIKNFFLQFVNLSGHLRNGEGNYFVLIEKSCGIES